MMIAISRRAACLVTVMGLALAGSFVPSTLPAQEEDKPYEVVDGVVDWYTYSGFRRYHSECHVCHGPDGMGSSFAPALLDSLKATERTDRQQGFTHVGPQRADIRVLLDGHSAGETLSRGEQKLVVCALKLAQGQLLADRRKRACVYLVDDLPAELDRHHCRLVAEVLDELKAQVFITCVDKREIAEAWPGATAGEGAMFHVEHGSVSRC